MTERTYIGLVVKDPDTKFWVHFPDFKQCFTCADTLEALPAVARDALETHINGLVEAPQPRKLNDILNVNGMDHIAVLDVLVDIPAAEADNKVTLFSHLQRGGPKL